MKHRFPLTVILLLHTTESTCVDTFCEVIVLEQEPKKKACINLFHRVGPTIQNISQLEKSFQNL